jgi:GDPmannose 4,6-dehydratase
MWLMLQQEAPDDYVLATGQCHSVRTFVERAYRHVERQIEWRGTRGSVEEVGIDARTGEVLIRIDPRYFRPTEVAALVGDPSKAREKLGWTHKTSFEALVREMVDADVKQLVGEPVRYGTYD